MATNLHAVFSSDCTKCILQLHYKINTVKKKKKHYKSFHNESIKK